MNNALCQLFWNKRWESNKLPTENNMVLNVRMGIIKFALPKIKLKMYETKTYKWVVDADILVSPLNPITS